MSSPVITVNAAVTQDNTQRLQRFVGTLTIGPGSATYPAGGIPIQAVMAAALSPASSSGPVVFSLISTLASGYIYTYIPSTGKLQILQAPASGSLTTAAPLSQLGAGLSGVAADVIAFDVSYEKNT